VGRGDRSELCGLVPDQWLPTRCYPAIGQQKGHRQQRLVTIGNYLQHLVARHVLNDRLTLAATPPL
jgi:hypothetical protein